MVTRDNRGRIVKGSAALNPGGRPKDAGLAELARPYTAEALEAAVNILRDESTQPADKLRAASLILDRGHGKPAQSLEGRLEVARSWSGEYLQALIAHNQAKTSPAALPAPEEPELP